MKEKNAFGPSPFLTELLCQHQTFSAANASTSTPHNESLVVLERLKFVDGAYQRDAHFSVSNS